MLDFFIPLAKFTLQTVVLLAALLVLIAFIASLISKGKDEAEIQVKNINKKFKKYQTALLQKTLDKKAFKAWLKDDKQTAKKATEKPNLFVLNFDGDIKASATEQLRREVSTILLSAKPQDEVVILLESPGGMVHGYGLAASQLVRLKNKGLKLTICVDKIAASGGYMMACIADRIHSAPYAIIGSIGVVASLPNFHRLLQKNAIDYYEVTAGEFKRTVTPLGEVTDSGMGKFKEQIQSVHDLFKNHVKTQRPQVAIETVSTGEYWYGIQAQELKLVDEISTSDDFLMGKIETHNLYSVQFTPKKSLRDKINESLKMISESIWERLLTINQHPQH